MKIFFLFLFLGLGGLSVKAQNGKSKYHLTDSVVNTFGALLQSNVATIADTITRPFAKKEDKARAIFYWIANNISLDPKATKSNNKKNVLPENVIALRKASSLGFSLLVQEMCSYAKIRCLSIDGYTKNFVEEIDEIASEVNHSWNVIQIGQSSETWYYVDAAKASGFFDKKMTIFTKNFTSEYFFAEKTIFNIDHHPVNEDWILGKGKKSLKNFYSLPVICYSAYSYELENILPITGKIQSKINKPIQFSFQYNNSRVESVALKIGETKKPKPLVPMNFTKTNFNLSFGYSFNDVGEYPITIIIDGKEFVSYMVDITD